jgi:hypothetical protein
MNTAVARRLALGDRVVGIGGDGYQPSGAGTNGRAIHKLIEKYDHKGNLDEMAGDAVLVGNSGSNILVVEPTQDRHGQGLTDGLDRARDRRVLLQGQMGARLVVVFLICVEQMTKVPFAKHNYMVKAIPPDGPF